MLPHSANTLSFTGALQLLNIQRQPERSPHRRRRRRWSLSFPLILKRRSNRSNVIFVARTCGMKQKQRQVLCPVCVRVAVAVVAVPAKYIYTNCTDRSGCKLYATVGGGISSGSSAASAPWDRAKFLIVASLLWEQAHTHRQTHTDTLSQFRIHIQRV